MPTEQISQLKIAGFKSLRQVEIEMSPCTLLIGANGTGKSNVMDFFQMLNFAFGTNEGGLQLYIARKGGASSLLFYGPQKTRNIDASIRFEGDRQWSRYSFSLSWGQPDNLLFTAEELEFQREDAPAPMRRLLGSGQVESKILSLANQQTDSVYRKEARIFRRRLRQIRFYHFHDTSEDAWVRLTQDLTRSDDYLMSNAGNLAVFLHNLRDNYPAHFTRILKTVQLVAPFITDFVLEPQVANQRSVMLRWRDSSGDVFGPHQLSDGTIRAISLVTALLQPESAMPSVMLFDEPELGLHPQAIGLIASLIKAASLKRQIIVATQSPRLVAEFSPEDVVVVERYVNSEGYGESQFNRLSEQELGGWLKDYDLGTLYEMNVTGGGPQ